MSAHNFGANRGISANSSFGNKIPMQSNGILRELSVPHQLWNNEFIFSLICSASKPGKVSFLCPKLSKFALWSMEVSRFVPNEPWNCNQGAKTGKGGGLKNLKKIFLTLKLFFIASHSSDHSTKRNKIFYSLENFLKTFIIFLFHFPPSILTQCLPESTKKYWEESEIIKNPMTEHSSFDLIWPCQHLFQWHSLLQLI